MVMTCFCAWVSDEKAETRNNLEPLTEVLSISKTDYGRKMDLDPRHGGKTW